MSKSLKAELEQTRPRVGVQFDAQLLDEVNAFREAQPIPPTQSETLRFLVRTGLKALRERPTPLREAQQWPADVPTPT